MSNINYIQFNFTKDKMENILYNMGYRFEVNDFVDSIYNVKATNKDISLCFHFDTDKILSEVTIQNWKSSFGFKEIIIRDTIIDIIINHFIKEIIKKHNLEFTVDDHCNWGIKFCGDDIIILKRNKIV